MLIPPPVVPPLFRPCCLKSCCLDPRSCSRLSDIWQMVENLERKQFIRGGRVSILLCLLSWTTREPMFSSPLFFLSRSLNAARIIRLSSKSTALSSWKDKETEKSIYLSIITLDQLAIRLHYVMARDHSLAHHLVENFFILNSSQFFGAQRCWPTISFRFHVWKVNLVGYRENTDLDVSWVKISSKHATNNVLKRRSLSFCSVNATNWPKKA